MSDYREESSTSKDAQSTDYDSMFPADGALESWINPRTDSDLAPGEPEPVSHELDPPPTPAHPALTAVSPFLGTTSTLSTAPAAPAAASSVTSNLGVEGSAQPALVRNMYGSLEESEEARFKRIPAPRWDPAQEPFDPTFPAKGSSLEREYVDRITDAMVFADPRRCYDDAKTVDKYVSSSGTNGEYIHQAAWLIYGKVFKYHEEGGRVSHSVDTRTTFRGNFKSQIDTLCEHFKPHKTLCFRAVSYADSLQNAIEDPEFAAKRTKKNKTTNNQRQGRYNHSKVVQDEFQKIKEENELLKEQMSYQAAGASSRSRMVPGGGIQRPGMLAPLSAATPSSTNRMAYGEDRQPQGDPKRKRKRTEDDDEEALYRTMPIPGAPGVSVFGNPPQIPFKAANSGAIQSDISMVSNGPMEPPTKHRHLNESEHAYQPGVLAQIQPETPVVGQNLPYPIPQWPGLPTNQQVHQGRGQQREGMRFPSLPAQIPMYTNQQYQHPTLANLQNQPQQAQQIQSPRNQVQQQQNSDQLLQQHHRQQPHYDTMARQQKIEHEQQMQQPMNQQQQIQQQIRQQHINQQQMHLRELDQTQSYQPGSAQVSPTATGHLQGANNQQEGLPSVSHGWVIMEPMEGSAEQTSNESMAAWPVHPGAGGGTSHPGYHQ